MDTRNRSRSSQTGSVSVQVLVILVPVLFGFIGFAIDLGRLYMIRGELKTAANAMALASAQRLIGTDQGLADAVTAAKIPIDTSTGYGNRYDFGGLTIGQTTGALASSVPDPVFFSTLQGALAGGDAGDGASARHARVTVTADAPLIFWRFLSLGQAGKVSVSASAVAGASAPLCTACAIEPLAVGVRDASDTVDFGFVQGTVYTFAYTCTGPPTPVALPNGSGGVQVIPYLILDRFNAGDATFPDGNSQLFRDGAGGMPGANTISGVQSCFSINNATPEVVWAGASPGLCTAAVPSPVSSAICGLDARFEPSPSATFSTVCSGIPSVGQLESAYAQDSDVAEEDTYVTYAGSGRRLITLPIVDVLNAAGGMTVQGFRQFLLQPNLNTTTLNPSDARGRFLAMYVGTVAPVKQGRFDGCQISSGPGKVVLHE